jgi:hypothetical protein
MTMRFLIILAVVAGAEGEIIVPWLSAAANDGRHSSHFNVGSKEAAQAPFHLWLALPDAKSTGPDRHA